MRLNGASFSSQLTTDGYRELWDGMARLSWPAWLITYRDGLPTHRQLSIEYWQSPMFATHTAIVWQSGMFSVASIFLAVLVYLCW